MPERDAFSLLKTLCRDAVKIQREYDKAHASNYARFEQLRPVLEQSLGDAASDLAPRKLQLTSLEIRTRVALETTRSFGFGMGIGIKPLNMSFEKRYSRQNSRQSQIELVVEQVPLSTSLKDVTQNEKENDHGESEQVD